MERKPCHEAIQQLAYILWEMRGRPDGNSEKDWLLAERELTSALADGRITGFDKTYVHNTASAGQLHAFARQFCR